MKTRFNLEIQIRISQDDAGNDRYTKEEILTALQSGDAAIVQHLQNQFIYDTTRNNKVMGEIEGFKKLK